MEIGFRINGAIELYYEWEIENAHIARHSYFKISRNKVGVPEGAPCWEVSFYSILFTIKRSLWLLRDFITFFLNLSFIWTEMVLFLLFFLTFCIRGLLS